MADTIIKLYDRKGDTGKFVGRAATPPDPADLVTFLTGKTYAGAKEYSEVTPGKLTTPKTMVQTELVQNDIDYKCVISYKDLSEPGLPVTRRLVIDAPIINEANGICVVIEGDSQSVPAILPTGGVGKAGNTIITEWETAIGATAGDFSFLSGGFIKVKK